MTHKIFKAIIRYDVDDNEFLISHEGDKPHKRINQVEINEIIKIFGWY